MIRQVRPSVGTLNKVKGLSADNPSHKYHPLEKTEPRVILSAEREESLRSSHGHTAWGFFTSFRMTGCLRFGPPHQHLLREAIYEMGLHSRPWAKGWSVVSGPWQEGKDGLENALLWLCGMRRGRLRITTG